MRDFDPAAIRNGIYYLYFKYLKSDATLALSMQQVRYVYKWLRKVLMKKTKSQSTSRSPVKKARAASSEMKGPIALDERSYLTEENGNFMLWDQQDFPSSQLVAQVDESVARTIISMKREGKNLLRDLYAQYEKRMHEQNGLEGHQ